MLRREMKLYLQRYENIVVVAHSMGGLISKAWVVKVEHEGLTNKIKLFISLAVPHLGSDVATFGTLFTSNLQLKDLAPLSETIPKLNDEWERLSRKPNVKYFYGTYDVIVKKDSAIGTDNSKQDIIACSDNHKSICKPAAKNSLVYMATIDFIKQSFAEGGQEADSEIKAQNDEAQFEESYSVLQFIFSDVQHKTVIGSKQAASN